MMTGAYQTVATPRLIVASTHEFAATAAAAIARLLLRAVAERDYVSVALAGATTSAPVYRGPAPMRARACPAHEEYR